jgi:antitoxin component YwqK of YwqJK toxin-antitoxin module
VLVAVYPDTAPLLKIFYKDAALNIKDGPFTLYNYQSRVAQDGYFVNNVANGHWRTYYSNGQLKEEGDIINNHFSGIWKAWYSNGLPMNSRQYLYNDSMLATGQPVHEYSPANKIHRVREDLVLEGKKEGSASTWYENGNRESVVNYHNDSLTGRCTWYRQNGQPSSIEVYTGGKITELECYDSTGKYTGATCSILKLPLLIHPAFSALDYIEYELHKEKNRDIKDEGVAEAKFTVTQNGTVENLQFLPSSDAALCRHIQKIFAAMPKWSPAVLHNRAIDYPMQLVIPYYRD